MNIKLIVKKILSPISKVRYKIFDSDGFLYVGKGCKIDNGVNMHFGKNVSIMPYTMLVCHGKESKIDFSDGVEVGMYSKIAAKSSVVFGENVLTGPHVFIADYNHEYRDVTRAIKHQGNYQKKTADFPAGGVYIGENSWIGTNVVIAGTVKIGENCVIGANSVVTTDIPDFSVAVGSPCRVIKKYSFEEKQWKKV